MTDADVDEVHILELFTFDIFYRCMKELIDNEHIYSQPPFIR